MFGFLRGSYGQQAVNLIGNISSFYTPQPPPPRMTYHAAMANEDEEEKQFREVFKKVAGDDMEVSPKELMTILNRVMQKYPELKTDGFSIESCRSIVALMDADSSGKLGLVEFKYIWNNIKKWQKVYKEFDADRSGTINGCEIPRALQAAGFNLDAPLISLITRRYSDENGDIDFDNYITCLTRLDAMFRAFKTLDKDNDGKIRVKTEEFLQMTMYS
ncbi:calpain small subunit 1-like [Protopterus annectens]|uniref:calpain small subunit 1-like n=1 Tax=Protopterus annectens TaxID=7888 RepID=UPI001CF9FEA8|nr:calpain small subunit 1-like [Protopterus annectens]